MRHLILLLYCSGGLLFLSACQQNPQPEEAATFDPTALQGTWKMIAEKPADSTELTEPSRVQYKTFTDGHFYFVSFDEETGAPAISGGGTYAVTRDSFTENLAYTSWDSTMAGASYTFAYTLEGDQLDQIGFMEATSEEEEDFYLHERYTRVEAPIAASKESNPLVGLWKMEAADWDGGEDPQPLRVGRVGRKLFTPGHFHVVLYDEATGKMGGNVFGTYTVNNDQFTESILTFTWDSTMVGRSFTFDWTLEEDRFTQSGVLPTPEDVDNRFLEQYRRVE